MIHLLSEKSALFETDAEQQNVLSCTAMMEVLFAMSNLPLTSREKQLLRRIAAGKTAAEISARFGGEPERVPEQRAKLLEKLGISAPAEIADAAAAGEVAAI
ncbi:hypothetical protein EOW77_0033750 [Bradyrhizobium yuanmingense]|uniref:LuxR C-terminal-related transcriptional regulator n=1 Tax=Bradyrhizobium yuanmingense TaxID=108015 RepID=UPI000FE34DE1|nr:LuxR C-terminal-related transcriptional regulator [Bradyrhizobium yuanmingense]TGN74456.1 hypothetical protein EOW77_0033750 [Bradyrhizobium yuanmingense]